jgi:hypothetical protein
MPARMAARGSQGQKKLCAGLLIAFSVKVALNDDQLLFNPWE